jgi:hypothetical protein
MSPRRAEKVAHISKLASSRLFAKIHCPVSEAASIDSNFRIGSEADTRILNPSALRAGYL